MDQPESKGLAHAIMIAENFLKNDSFVMYLGDNMLKQGAKPLIELSNKNKSDCVIGVSKVKDSSRYGVVVFNKEGGIEKLVEKPKEPISDFVLIGVYVFNEKIFDAVKQIKPS
ncbi:MAG: sugar phosphate nucleotidyltransferase [Candidatus Bathyarchaeia archaeon]